MSQENNNQKTIKEKYSFTKFIKKINTKNKIIILIPVSIFLLILCILLFRPSASNPILANSVNLLGKECNEIIADNNFKVSRMFDISLAKSTTDELFGVSGMNEIFIFEDDEYVEIVTWQSDEDIELTDKEKKAFLKNMIKVYGKTKSSTDENHETSYLWVKKDYTVMLKLEDEVYITWASNE